MRVLYISNFSESSGWSRAGRDYILALDAAGVDVVPRPFKLSPAKAAPIKRIQELQDKTASAKPFDCVIQHLLPHHMDYYGGLLNIGLYASETSDFRGSAWADSLNTMDSVIVINDQMIDAARRSGVTVPIAMCNHAADIEVYQQSYRDLEVLKPYKEAGDFLFYFIGEFIARKNIPALMKAFHLEFDIDEPVQLVLKTNCVQGQAQALAEEIRRGLKLFQYKDEIWLLDRYSDTEMCRLHTSCDCNVSPSFGEAWSYPTFDAMAFGKTPIATKCTGFMEYLDDTVGWRIDGVNEPVFGAVDTFKDLFVGSESWCSIDIGGLRKAMREAFENRELKRKKASGIKRSYSFSYLEIGSQLKGIIDAELARAKRRVST